ncbi:aspartate kinase [Candidatus Gottesmanbacteria bacterium RBG_16_52_11]|uniref:Uridylate kinase n=1 Tax=Candidatus Gottesmanbacteria bacterium RBG_16_52_11 TaxID=1798374 RepID=A0A1F5YVH4_9BACT|nr:MAG: aspartate kinase [Candidatus Gottesmanbacteria bacterium RBG_16_52_11]
MSFGKDAFVLSLGGSIVVPKEGIDTQFLNQFNTFIRHQISSKKRRFFIVVGGGSTARKYRDAAEMVVGHRITDEDLDWIGIHATRLNAHMLRVIFRDIAHTNVLKHYEIIRKVDEPVVIAAGWKPGWSTDYCAVTICQDYGIKNALNLTNVDQVYDKDPRKHADARPLSKITWKAYRRMTGDTWIPGMNLPFDPIASRLASELGVTVRILNGKDFHNLELALDGKPFFGTTISK